MDDDTTKVVSGSDAPTDPHASSSPAVPIEPGTQIGRYVVLHAVGKGGMGEILAANDPELDRRVALKLLPTRALENDPQAEARLLREARALAKLSHPNVVAVFDVGMVGDRVYVAMELIEGVTLKKWLAQERRPWRRVLAVLVAANGGTP